jgi:hypothetical protein
MQYLGGKCLTLRTHFIRSYENAAMTKRPRAGSERVERLVEQQVAKRDGRPTRVANQAALQSKAVNSG